MIELWVIYSHTRANPAWWFLWATLNSFNLCHSVFFRTVWGTCEWPKRASDWRECQNSCHRYTSKRSNLAGWVLFPWWRACSKTHGGSVLQNAWNVYVLVCPQTQMLSLQTITNSYKNRLKLFGIDNKVQVKSKGENYFGLTEPF